MSLLTPEQKAAMRATKAPGRNHTVDVYRSPDQSGGKFGVVAKQNAQPVACRIWPAASRRAAGGRVDLAPANLDGARISHYVIFDDVTTDVQRGDELRAADGKKYKVSDTQGWTTTRVVLVEEVKPKI